MFKFENVIMSYYSNHNCLRMVDYEFVAYDPTLIRDLSIVQFCQDSTFLKWDDLRTFIKGIGKRTWFLHNLRNTDGKFDSGVIHRKQLTSEMISERKV